MSYEEKMQKAVDNLSADYATIRAGRANPHILDKLKVDYYGTPTNLQSVANVSVPEARTLMITPWEASMVKVIEKAIQISDLGVTPNNDGKNVIINFPELTEERRKELAKDIKKKGEDAKVVVRNARRDANEAAKKQSKAGEISEDDLADEEKNIQKATDKFIAEIDKLIEAKSHMPRNFGHKAGADNLEQIIEDAWDLGIKYLTVYAFSTENWKRSVEEVTGLMLILRDFLKKSIDKANKNNMRVRVIGRRDRLDADIVDAIEKLEDATKDNTGIQFIVALNYGGRDEITRATQKIAEEVKNGIISVEDITEDYVSSKLDTADIPDPDLLIRTSGELRTSNFLPWQISYSEFYFTDTLWPDFNKDSLRQAIDYYNGRDRRFGGAE